MRLLPGRLRSLRPGSAGHPSAPADQNEICVKKMKHNPLGRKGSGSVRGSQYFPGLHWARGSSQKVIRAYDGLLFQLLLTGQPCAFSRAGHWRYKEDFTGRQRNGENGIERSLGN